MIKIKNLIIVISVLVIFVAAGIYLMMNKPTSQQQGAEDVTIYENSTMSNLESSGMDESSESAEGSVKEFTVTGSNFKFDIPEIRVKEGDTVKVTFKNASGHHDFVIDEFNAATAQTNGPSEETVTFVADKVGTFEYYCSVVGHKLLGMKGNLIVE